MVRTKIGLLLTIFRENRIPDIFTRVGKFDETPLDADKALEFLECPPEAVCSIRLVPAYLTLVLRDPGKAIVKIPHENWGYSIDLKGCNTVDDYLASQFNSKYRSIIRRYVSRLEACFQTEYTLYGGEITKERYLDIMSALQSMINRRFTQRQESHKEEKIWNDILEKTYALIQKNKATLFVIYADGEPIEISLNYHFNGILFSSISSYDIDYSKFGLGHVEIYKQLQWCLANGYRLFEMGVGGMDYKRRWSNNIYQFEHLVIFKNQWPQSVIALLEIGKIRIKEYLKSKKINEALVRAKNRMSAAKQGPAKSEEGPTLSKVELASVSGDWEEIDWRSEGPGDLRSHVIDFLYSNEEKKSDIMVFRSGAAGTHYLVKGRKNAQEILYT